MKTKRMYLRKSALLRSYQARMNPRQFNRFGVIAFVEAMPVYDREWDIVIDKLILSK